MEISCPFSGQQQGTNISSLRTFFSRFAGRTPLPRRHCDTTEQMHSSAISVWGLAILPAYFALTLVIGWFSKRRGETANSFLNASRSLPLWIVSASFLAANCGALEIVGLSAMAAQYGVQAFHFYWIGAIPAMVFLALWMMPIYISSGIRSIPEYLAVRFGPGVRLLNAAIVAATMLMLAGISLYAMAQVLEVVIGLPFLAGVLVSAGIVLIYALLGGVKATIYTEVFQLLVMIAGLLPLCLRSLPYLPNARALHTSQWHLWQATPAFSTQAPMDSFGVVFGLGFVLSFGYWCTDFVLMQRALASRSESEARQVPLWAGFGKLAFSLIVVLPGLAACRLFPQLGHSERFDQALPRMMATFYGPTMLGVGLTALAASLMSGLAANVSGFASVWTEDIYRSWLVRDRPDSHYIRMGRGSTAIAILLSILASFISFFFSNLMDHIQLIFSLTNAPFWAIFLLGMTVKRATARGAFYGLSTGVLLGIVHHLCVYRHWLVYGSVMSANFHVAIYSFASAFAVGWLFRTNAPNASAALPATSHRLLFNMQVGLRGKNIRWLWLSSALLLSACVLLNLIFR